MLNTLTLQKVNPGDPISAEQWNQMIDAINRLAGINVAGAHMLETPAGLAILPVQQPELNFVELDEIDGIPHNEDADNLERDVDVSSGSDPWISASSQSHFVTPPYSGVWLTGERSVVMRHSGAGKNVLLPFTQWHLAKLNDDLFEGSTSTASIWEIAASGEDDSNRDVTVHPWTLPENERIAVDSKVIVAQHRQSGRWYVIDWVREDVKEGVLDGALSPASGAKTGETTATLSVYTETASGVHDSGEDITVTQRLTESGTIAAGAWVVVRRINGEWRPILADCAETDLEGVAE